MHELHQPHQDLLARKRNELTGCEMKERTQGVTLIELMVVVALLAIIASIAVPNYRSYMLRSHRADATAELLRVRTAQEKFFLQNNQYADDAQLTVAPPAGLGLNSASEHGFYTVVLDRTSPTTYVVTATATGGQTDDAQCQTYTINEAGVRSSAPYGITTCWK